MKKVKTMTEIFGLEEDITKRDAEKIKDPKSLHDFFKNFQDTTNYVLPLASSAAEKILANHPEQKDQIDASVENSQGFLKSIELVTKDLQSNLSKIQKDWDKENTFLGKAGTAVDKAKAAVGGAVDKAKSAISPSDPRAGRDAPAFVDDPQFGPGKLGAKPASVSAVPSPFKKSVSPAAVSQPNNSTPSMLKKPSDTGMITKKLDKPEKPGVDFDVYGKDINKKSNVDPFAQTIFKHGDQNLTGPGSKTNDKPKVNVPQSPAHSGIMSKDKSIPSVDTSVSTNKIFRSQADWDKEINQLKKSGAPADKIADMERRKQLAAKIDSFDDKPSPVQPAGDQNLTSPGGAWDDLAALAGVPTPGQKPSDWDKANKAAASLVQKNPEQKPKVEPKQEPVKAEPKQVAPAKPVGKDWDKDAAAAAKQGAAGRPVKRTGGKPAPSNKQSVPVNPEDPEDAKFRRALANKDDENELDLTGSEARTGKVMSRSASVKDKRAMDRALAAAKK